MVHGVAVPDSGVRLDRTVVLLQLAQYLYRRVATTCDAIESTLAAAEPRDLLLEDLRRWEYELQQVVHAFLTPTFSYDYTVLLMRDALMGSWRLAPLLARTEFLTRNLQLFQTARRLA